MRIHLAAAALLLLGSSCSTQDPAGPDAAPTSSPAAPSASTTPAADPPPDPCDLLEPFQLKRMFREPGDYAKATWTHELMGKDGNFYGCVGTLRDFNYVRFGFAVTPNAYLREYKQGKVFGKDLSPTESPGLGDRGYVREAHPQGYESMAKSGEWTVYVHSIGARDHRDVVAALQYLLGQTTPAMTQSPVQLREPCPAVDSPALDPTAAALYRGSVPKIDRSRPIGGNPKALFAYADEFIAAHG